MIPAVNDQRSNPAPIQPEAEADIDADFVNGIYLSMGSTVAVGDITNYSTDRIFAGIGMAGFDNLWNVSGATSTSNPSAALLNDALAIVLSGNFTMVLEWHNYNGNFGHLFHVADAGDTSAHRFVGYDFSWNYFWVFDWLNPGGDNRERDITKDGDTPIYLTQGNHVVAITRTDEYLALSIDGGLLKKVTADQHTFAALGLTDAVLMGLIAGIDGDLLVGRLRLFATPQGDEFLPGLSNEVTVLTSPANQYFVAAETITSGQTLDGRTFGADDEDDPADTDEDWQPSVWFKFVAPATASYDIEIINVMGNIIGGAEFAGWVIDIYNGGPAYGDLNLVAQAFASPWPTPPSYTLAATSGTTYWFKVYGDSVGEGIFQISVS